jgi:hypothetical protein
MDYYIFLGRKRRINISRIQLESCRRFNSAAVPEPSTPRNPQFDPQDGNFCLDLASKKQELEGLSKLNARSAKAVRVGETDLERRARGQASTPAGAGRPCLLVAVAA